MCYHTTKNKKLYRWTVATELRRQKSTGYNSTYKKLAVQWLNEALCFVSSVVLADSLVLRNRQLLVAANRYVGLKIMKHTLIIVPIFGIFGEKLMNYE